MLNRTNQVISGTRLIRSEGSRIQSRLSSSCTHLNRTQNKSSLTFLQVTNRYNVLRGSRITFTRATSSQSGSVAVYPGTHNILSSNNEDQEDNTANGVATGFFTSSTSTEASSLAPVGFRDYDIRWKEVKKPTLSGLIPIYLDLSKARLAALVALTTMSGYAMTPAANDLTTLFSLTVGTTLCITSANAYNQFVEPPYDAQMTRTRNRVLVRKAVSPLHAWTFATATGLGGVGILATAVNPLTAALGAANLALYAAVYTPMKRMSIANTWVGSVVGAIPPMMGWAACTNSLGPEAWLMGFLLYAWQFPHFNSLAWNLRADYSKAGYRMMSVTDPKLNARVSLRYTLALVPLVTLAPYLDMTSWWFALDGNIVNAAMVVGAANFWRKRDDKSAKQLFFGSLIYLPVILALMMLHKKVKKAEDDAADKNAFVPATSVNSAVEDDDDEYEYVDVDEDDDEEFHTSTTNVHKS
ncbi:Protoheme IX farnesyltransferase, mitochondrial [Linnemannia zychae]|nr:Protoheme IX farnesyltransferase, mitochondrial [Linnemannia zychae]